MSYSSNNNKLAEFKTDAYKGSCESFVSMVNNELDDIKASEDSSYYYDAYCDFLSSTSPVYDDNKGVAQVIHDISFEENNTNHNVFIDSIAPIGENDGERIPKTPNHHSISKYNVMVDYLLSEDDLKEYGITRGDLLMISKLLTDLPKTQHKKVIENYKTIIRLSGNKEANKAMIEEFKLEGFNSDNCVFDVSYSDYYKRLCDEGKLSSIISLEAWNAQWGIGKEAWEGESRSVLDQWEQETKDFNALVEEKEQQIVSGEVRKNVFNQVDSNDCGFFESSKEAEYKLKVDNSLRDVVVDKPLSVEDFKPDKNDICIIDTVSLTGALKLDNKAIYRQTTEVIEQMTGGNVSEIVAKNPYWGMTLSEYFEEDLKAIFDHYEGDLRTNKPIELHLASSNKNGYLYTYNIIAHLNNEDTKIGSLMCGGNKNKNGEDTFQLLLEAGGCKFYQSLGLEYQLYAYAVKNDMRITRADIAIDDFEGEFDLVSIVNMHNNGRFKVRQQPQISMVGDPSLYRGDPRGRTMYIGARSSARYVRHYEKGKQLGDKESKWVRHEAELKAKNLFIPLEVILYPAKYFAHNEGLRDILNTLTGSTTELYKLSPIKYIAKKCIEITVKSMKDYFKTSYGKWLFSLRQFYASADEMLDDLQIEEVAPRLRHLLPPVPMASTEVHCHVN